MDRPRHLSRQQRTAIFDKTTKIVTKWYFDPKYNGTNWPERARDRRDEILQIDDPEQFEMAVHNLVSSIGTSHTGFFHQSVKRVPARLSIGANFRRTETPAGDRWVVQDVHDGGPAQRAGLRSRDVLSAVNGKPVVPPEQTAFPMGQLLTISVERDGQPVTVYVDIPVPKSRKQPHADLTPVSSSILPDGIGYLKVTVLPGLLGLDVAREIDAAFKSLAECDRLILDLRGHVGGGLGVLRLMSHLVAGKVPIGFTVTRKRAEAGYKKEELRRLDRLPTDRPNFLAMAEMASRFVGRDPSVALYSEGLGPKKWHGRAVILVNEHTVSAGEMVAAFAQENHLAALVGTETAGRLTPSSGFKVGDGYMLVIPKAAYMTWMGRRFEGRGIEPDVRLPWVASDRFDGDSQLDRAKEFLRGICTTEAR